MGKYLEPENTFFAEEKKNGEGKGGKYHGEGKVVARRRDIEGALWVLADLNKSKSGPFSLKIKTAQMHQYQTQTKCECWRNMLLSSFFAPLITCTLCACNNKTFEKRKKEKHTHRVYVEQRLDKETLEYY